MPGSLIPGLLKNHKFHFKKFRPICPIENFLTLLKFKFSLNESIQIWWCISKER